MALFAFWRRSFGACLAALVLLGITGCKTQQDAEAAASQMAATAALLSDYYGALDVLTTRTEDAYRVQAAINGAPFDDQQLASMEDRRTELRKRAAFAADLARVCELFGRISGSTAAADSADAASALNADLISFNALKEDDTEIKALHAGVSLVVQLIQQHEEIKAARAVAPLAHDLQAFYAKEEPLYVSIGNEYLTVAASNAKFMIAHSQVAPAVLYDSSVRPFGMAPEITDAALKTGVSPYLQAQLTTRLADGKAAAEAAANNVDLALREMDARVNVVAQGHVLAVRVPPITLGAVRHWIDVIDSFGVNL